MELGKEIPLELDLDWWVSTVLGQGWGRCGCEGKKERGCSGSREQREIPDISGKCQVVLCKWSYDYGPGAGLMPVNNMWAWTKESSRYCMGDGEESLKAFKAERVTVRSYANLCVYNGEAPLGEARVWAQAPIITDRVRFLTYFKNKIFV